MSEAEERLNRWPSKSALYVAAVAVLVLVVIGFFAYQALNNKVDTSTETQKIALALAANTECARQISSDYEDYRDAIFANLDNRPALLAAVDAFRQFKIAPDGTTESRAERTKRLCPNPR
jgi:hypothetical protein